MLKPRTSAVDTSWLRDNCPRLSLAVDQHYEWLAAECTAGSLEKTLAQAVHYVLMAGPADA